MAVSTIRGRECRSGGRVHWVVRVLPIGLVATGIGAVGGRNFQVVVSVRVALRALQGRDGVLAG